MSTVVPTPDLIEQFKAKADVRQVDTTNSRGYGGYRGQVYSYKNLELFDVVICMRFETPRPNVKYLFGTTRIAREEFMSKLTKIV